MYPALALVSAVEELVAELELPPLENRLGHHPRHKRWALAWQRGKKLKNCTSELLPGYRLPCYDTW